MEQVKKLLNQSTNPFVLMHTLSSFFDTVDGEIRDQYVVLYCGNGKIEYCICPAPMGNKNKDTFIKNVAIKRLSDYGM